jgi:hypothetical protein
VQSQRLRFKFIHCLMEKEGNGMKMKKGTKNPGAKDEDNK